MVNLLLLAVIVVALIVWSEVRDLRRRVATLEREIRQLAKPAGVSLPHTPAPSAPPAPTGPPPRPVPTPVPMAQAPAAGEPRPAPAAAPAAAAPAVASPTAATVAPIEEPSAGWEVTVGANWLNKIGVLVFVLGLGMLVSFSVTQVGPAGRIAIGYAISLLLLGTGIALERRGRYRNYAYGLVAGGWAGAYFTTYALRAVEAARLVESDVTGTLLLTLVAVALLGHALRYPSQTVVSLALVVVYVTLGATPLSGFAMIAALPLAAVVLVAAERRGWTGISALGIAATYLLFALRGAGGASGALGGPAAPYLLLAAYWLTFEAVDLFGLARRRGRPAVPRPLFALNAAGIAGASILVLPTGDMARQTTYLAALGLAYVGSALVRRRLIGGVLAEPDPTASRGFTSFHAAMAMATLLLMWASGTRFDGTRLSVFWLLEAELIVAAAFAMGDARLRGVGHAALMITTLHAIGTALVGSAGSVGWLGGVEQTSVVLLLVAAARYLNREALRRRGSPALALERATTWVATALVAGAIAQETTTMRTGLLWVAGAWLLVEVGLRHAAEYRYQAYALGALGGWLTWIVFGQPPLNATTPQVWVHLGGSTVVLGAIAARLGRRAGPGPIGELALAAGAASCAAALLVAELEWRLVPLAWLGLALGLTGLLLAVAGITRAPALLRWQGYAFLTGGALTALGRVLAVSPAAPIELVGSIVTIVLLYAVTLLVRDRLATERAVIESFVRSALPVMATLMLAALIVNEVRPSYITLAWGLGGLALLLLGFPTGERIIRLPGLGLLALSVLKLFVYDMRELDALPRILSFVMLGLVLLGVSWGYTRFRREPLSKKADMKR